MNVGLWSWMPTKIAGKLTTKKYGKYDWRLLEYCISFRKNIFLFSRLALAWNQNQYSISAEKSTVFGWRLIGQAKKKLAPFRVYFRESLQNKTKNIFCQESKKWRKPFLKIMKNLLTSIYARKLLKLEMRKVCEYFYKLDYETLRRDTDQVHFSGGFCGIKCW